MQQRTELVKDRDGILELAIRDDDGMPVNADALPTATIVDSAGTAIGGSVTVLDPTEAGEGIYRIQLTAAQLTTLDRYTVTWNTVIATRPRVYRTELEVVDQHLVELGDIREFDAHFDDPAAYPASKLRRARDQISERIEEAICGVAFRRRGARERIDGTGLTKLLLPHLYPATLISGRLLEEETWTSLTNAELAAVRLYDEGLAIRTDGNRWDRGHRNVELFYTHGLSGPPASIQRAALLMIRRALVDGPAEENVSSYTNDAGTFRLTVEGRDGPTGIPEADAILGQFDYSAPAVG